ncbi:biopolymer transporter TolR [Dyella jiangningensis]|jgi:biopolymer transport protein TolR|uniref:protein TolR n=1 Tax=Dyella jiangningensis TaxID=1379159 RepID=UPI0004562962|nr:protein TolR [Dyella jiangningensis]AHX14509.1 biopolymer transporter TolR [Dyella jiangningensis]MDG2538061.1 protein TolR [Dyella jiangningensis]
MRSSARHKRLKLKSEINVVPYIDVMLVLLIIFMVATPMLNANVDVNLPQANAKSLQDKKEPVIVSVDHNGQLYLTLGTEKKQPIDAQTMQAKVGAFVKANPEVSVLVAGDRDGKYDGVYQVLAQLQQAGVAKVGLMSQPESGSKK